MSTVAVFRLTSRTTARWLGVIALLGTVAPAPMGAQEERAAKPSATAVSCDVITAEQIEGKPSVALALRGHVTGLQLMPTSGQAGAGSQVNLRGINSMRSTAPLVFVDGLLIGEVRGKGQAITLIDQMNPNDVLLIEVFRGPAATTLYGTNAAGGVIRIYTKHGNPRAELLTDERARCIP